MTKALFVFSIYHYYREMLDVAVHLRAQGWQVDALIGWQGESAEAAEATCRDHGFAVARVPDPFSYGDHLKVPHRPAERNATAIAANGRLRSALRRELLRPLQVAGAARRFHRTKAWTARYLSSVAPDMVFGGPYHSAGRFDNAFATLCRGRGIPYFCLPTSPYVGERQATNGRFNNLAAGMLESVIRADHDLVSRVLALLFRRWTKTRNGLRLFVFDPTEMFGAWLTGTLEKNPWQKPAESYDLVFVDSKFSRMLLEDSKYTQEKIVVSGSPLLDTVIRNLARPEHRHELMSYLGLPTDGGFLLFNVEPSAEHLYASWDEHWKNFNGLMDELATLGCPIVLSLHPLCDIKNYRFVEAKYGFKISERYKIHDLYPYCTASVSFVCSTNLLAERFDRPLVIYDFFGMTLESDPEKSFFYRMPGARYAYSTAEMGEQVRTVLATRSNAVAQEAAMPRTACEVIEATVLDHVARLAA